MLRSMPPSGCVIHGSSLNSFCGWNSSFLPSAAEDQEHQDRDREVGAEADQDFGFGASSLAGLGRCLALRLPAPRARTGGRGPGRRRRSVKRTPGQDGGGEAASRRRQADEQDDGRHQPDAAEGGRGEDRPSPAGGCPRRVRPPALATGQELDRRAGSEPGAGGDGVAEQWANHQARKTASAAARTSRSTYLGGDINPPCSGSRADERLYPKGPSNRLSRAGS